MPENETIEKPKGLRASNTHTTLAPKSIFEAAGVPDPQFRTATISEGVAAAMGATIDENGTLHDTGEFKLVRKPSPPTPEETWKMLEGPFAKNTETVYVPVEVNKEWQPENKAMKPEVLKAGYVVKAPLTPRFSSIGALVDEPLPAESRATKSLVDRVQKLEEQMDSILDRFAKYNVRAQHRI
jgi:hypothetical protein